MGLRAMFSGVSGLQANSTWLDVIGNNISNTNTVAYKASRVSFADAMSQTLGSGSGNAIGSNLGGVNPMQVGLGTRVASIQTLFTPGPQLQTGNNTDIAITGEGFLIAQKNSQTFYTRAGNLGFDGEGYLVDANGGLIQGFQATVAFSTRTINDNSSLGVGVPAVVTDASLVLDTSNTGAISAIQIRTGMTVPPRATSVLEFSGNLDSFCPAWNDGNLGTAAAPYLPIQGDPAMVNFDVTIFAAANPVAQPDGTNKLDQIADMNWNGYPTPPIVNPIDLFNAQQGVLSDNYVWNQPQTDANRPSATIVQTVYDSLGNPREITFLFYQVMDMSQTGPNPMPGPSQAAYAWYAFETTGGEVPYTGTVVGRVPNLLGGTGIVEGFNSTNPVPNGYNRGLVDAAGAPNVYYGNLLFFNTDGSLATSGGILGTAGAANDLAFTNELPRVYLPATNPSAAVGPVSPIPTVGAEIMAVDLNFGTPGMLGTARRDGLYSDAAGSMQVINGVNTYVPNQSAYVRSQDGYQEGTLQDISFDGLGVIQGQFSNGKTIALGQVVMARIDNPEGLNKVGSNYYTTSANSGSVYVGLAGRNSLGTIQGYSLEGSNVDLTVELTNLIIAQRGFEVNARSISTTNETLNTIVNLGR
jgi:flagellar hook protein FlgE